MLIAFSGKIGSGKNEGSKQLLKILVNGARIEEKAIAENVKKLVASLTGTPDEFQFTSEGKNTEIKVFNTETREILLDVYGMITRMEGYKRFKDISRDDTFYLEEIVFSLINEMLSDFSKKQEYNKGEFLVVNHGVLQQEIGTRMKEKIDDGVWIELLFEEWNPSKFWSITDLRFRIEKAFIEARNGYCLRMNGDPKKVNANTKRDPNHISETDLDNEKTWSAVIDNSVDDLENLKKQLQGFVENNKEKIGQHFVLSF